MPDGDEVIETMLDSSGWAAGEALTAIVSATEGGGVTRSIAFDFTCSGQAGQTIEKVRSVAAVGAVSHRLTSMSARCTVPAARRPPLRSVRSLRIGSADAS